MAWVTIAEGDFKAFEAGEDSVITDAGKGKQIRHGAPFTIEVTSNAIFSPAWDLAGMEIPADLFFNKTHSHLIDVEGVGGFPWRTIRLHCEANAVVIAPALLFGVAAILVSLGILTAIIKMDAPGEALESIAKTAQWAGLAIIAVVIVVVLAQAGPMLKGLQT